MKRHTITVLFLTLGAGLLLVGVDSGRAQVPRGSSKQVTFKTAEKAPSDFNAWTFFWKAPTKDPDAKLDYIVVQPDGNEYFKYDVSRVKAGALNRSDFKPGFAGGDPSVFYNQHITITFRASKGDLVFEPSGKYFFRFRSDRKATASTPAASLGHSGRAGQFTGKINHALTMAREKNVYILPTHETDKGAQEEIHTYIRAIRDKFANSAPMLTDDDALQKNLSNDVVIAYGTPTGNLWLARILASVPVRIETNRILADMEYSGTSLRFISAWPNPQNPQNGVVIYTAQQAKDIVGINGVFHGPTDYVLAQDANVLIAEDYSKQEGRWLFPVVKTINAIMEVR